MSIHNVRLIKNTIIRYFGKTCILNDYVNKLVELYAMYKLILVNSEKHENTESSHFHLIYFLGQ